MTDMNILDVRHLEAAYPCVERLVDTIRAATIDLLPATGLLRSSVYTARARRCAQHIELLELFDTLHDANIAAADVPVLFTLHHKQFGELGVYTSIGALFAGLVEMFARSLSTTEHLVIRRGTLKDASTGGEITFSYLLGDKR